MGGRGGGHAGLQAWALAAAVFARSLPPIHSMTIFTHQVSSSWPRRLAGAGARRRCIRSVTAPNSLNDHTHPLTVVVVATQACRRGRSPSRPPLPRVTHQRRPVSDRYLTGT